MKLRAFILAFVLLALVAAAQSPKSVEPVKVDAVLLNAAQTRGVLDGLIHDTQTLLDGYTKERDKQQAVIDGWIKQKGVVGWSYNPTSQEFNPPPPAPVKEPAKKP